jgi:undecaprenyl diphosphate synthase
MEMSEETERAIARLVDEQNLPGHIAIIMDGNGRWARKRNLPRLAGHREGRESVRAAVRTCAKLGVSALSLYTFSLENWKRPKTEVQGLMRFLKNVLRSEYLELSENNIQLRASGRLDMLPKGTLEALNETIEKLSINTGMVLNLCLSYSGRAEIVDAARKLIEEAMAGRLKAEKLDERTFARFLYAPDVPDPDLLIRTSGELRISNFLLWQLAYTEIVVMDVLWPDFREEHLLEAINIYLRRERRFGAVEKHMPD